jgi:hypothetical protein
MRDTKRERAIPRDIQKKQKTNAEREDVRDYAEHCKVIQLNERQIILQMKLR